jgi:hypothetical protein
MPVLAPPFLLLLLPPLLVVVLMLLSIAVKVEGADSSCGAA